MDLSVLFGLVSSGAGLLSGKPRKGGSRDAWQTAAETYGLLHKPSSFWSGPKLSGRLSGNDLTVDIKNRNTASAETRFRLDVPSMNLGLRLRKRGFWNRLGSRTLTGDKAFDNQVVANGRNEFAVREFLTPERRTAIQSFVSSFKGAVVTDDRISLTTRGYVKNSDEMLGAIDAMTLVARALSEDAHSMPDGRSAGTLAAAISPFATVETFAREPELATASETDPEQAHADESELADALADESDEPKESEVESTSPSDSLMPPKDSLGVEEFCATVFAPGALSFSANKVFKESYEGERVAWAGTLESLTPFQFDFDFGSGRGIKAVLTILESEAVGSRDVQAVIGLPPGVEGLAHRIGQPVSFAGRLLKVDGLAKRVVIADAELRPSSSE